MKNTLSLSDALSSGRLEDFVRQCEASGMASADVKELDSAFADIIKPQQLSSQTLHYPLSDGLIGN